MKKAISIGIQGFSDLREQDCFFVDKTNFIKEWWENRDVVTLITRPRRFGKTLNMSMLDCFFSNKYVNRADLFEGLSIWQNETYRKVIMNKKYTTIQQKRWMIQLHRKH